MADGIAVKRPGQRTLHLVKQYVDDLVTVDEVEISRTMLLLLERNKLLVEGSGAVSLAAMLNQKLPIQNKKVVTIISGGNVDVSFISRIIERGMVESGRFMQFSTIIKDSPGNLVKILQVVTGLEGNILNASQTHMGDNVFPNYVQLTLSIETKDHDHIQQIYLALKQKGYNFE